MYGLEISFQVFAGFEIIFSGSGRVWAELVRPFTTLFHYMWYEQLDFNNFNICLLLTDEGTRKLMI